MIIVVEGSNKVGKSTIINRLASMHNAEVIYNRDIRKEMKDAKQEGYISALSMLSVLEKASRHANVILDRFHLSEYVYGDVEREYKSEKMFSVIDKQLAEMNSLLVLVTSSYEHLRNTPRANMLCRYSFYQNVFVEAYKRSIMNKMQIRLEDIK